MEVEGGSRRWNANRFAAGKPWHMFQRGTRNDHLNPKTSFISAIIMIIIQCLIIIIIQYQIIQQKSTPSPTQPP